MSNENNIKETKKDSKEKNKTTSKSDKLGLFKSIAKFFRDYKNEVKKIVWPAPKAVFKNTGIVLVVIFIIGLFVFGLDLGLIKLLGLFMDVAG